MTQSHNINQEMTPKKSFNSSHDSSSLMDSGTFTLDSGSLLQQPMNKETEQTGKLDPVVRNLRPRNYSLPGKHYYLKLMY